MIAVTDENADSVLTDELSDVTAKEDVDAVRNTANYIR